MVLPEDKEKDFRKEVRDLLSVSGLTSFHAKKFKESQKNEYKNFLRIIRKYCAQGPMTLLACTLNSENWNAKFFWFCENIFTDVLTNVKVKDLELIEVTKRFVPPLFTLQRLTRDFSIRDEIRIEVDSDEVKRNYHSLRTKITNCDFDAPFLLEKFYNIYRKQRFSDSPVLQKNGIQVLKEKRSVMIQAADVIGNFSTSYIYYRLGGDSKKRKLKGKIFESVFDDFFRDKNFLYEIEMVGKNDLRLKTEGALTLMFGFYS